MGLASCSGLAEARGRYFFLVGLAGCVRVHSHDRSNPTESVSASGSAGTDEKAEHVTVARGMRVLGSLHPGAALALSDQRAVCVECLGSPGGEACSMDRSTRDRGQFVEGCEAGLGGVSRRVVVVASC